MRIFKGALKALLCASLVCSLGLTAAACDVDGDDESDNRVENPSGGNQGGGNNTNDGNGEEEVDTTVVADPEIESYSAYNESLQVTWIESLPKQAKVYYSVTGANDWVPVDGGLISTPAAERARVDIVGLDASKRYDVKISSNGKDIFVKNLGVSAYDRSGYAHFEYSEGVGAYNDDGTLKSGALVIYVNEENKNTVKTGYVDGKEVDLTPYLWQGKAGIGWILNNRGYTSNADRENYGIQKLCFTYGAVAIRIIGKVNAEESTGKISLIDGLTAYNSTDNGGSVGDNGRMARITNAKNLTIEGIGEDACIYGWGIHFVSNDNLHKYAGSGKSFEVRNITFDHYPEDAIGMEGTQGTKVDSTGSITSGASSADSDLISPVERCWIHNNVFLPGYASSPAESDKSEGDGSCDFKRGQYYTLSYNYFEYCHKTNLIGSADSSLTYNVTMHHNWWYNCGSRQPLARRANIHFYNNYIYGDANDSEASLSYVSSFRANCLLFSEANYFDGSKNVTQKKDGVGIAWNNIYYACTSENLYTEMSSRTQEISNSCKFIGREIDYSSFYIDPSLFYYDDVNEVSDCLLDDAATARVKVMTGAGVNGFGKDEEQTQFNVHTPSAAVPLSNNEINIDLEPIGRGKVATTVQNVYFAANNGWSSGSMKIRGQGITFTLDRQAELEVNVTSSGDSAAELVRSDGTVINGKFTGRLVVVLKPGTYVIASGQKDKDTYISSLSFADSAISSEARIEEAKTAINAIPSTVTLSDKAKIEQARMAYNALTDSERTAFDSENAALVTKLVNAETELGRLQIAEVERLIEAIGTVDKNSHSRILAAETAYNALPSNLKLQVSESAYSTLVSALETYAQFAVDNVNELISALEDVSGWTTDRGRAAIEAELARYEEARAEYEELSADSDEGEQSQRDKVENYDKVTQGIAKLESLLADIERVEQEQAALDEFVEKLENISDVSALSINDCKLIIALYNGLSAEKQTEYAENETYKNVLAAYAEFAKQAKLLSFTSGTNGYNSTDFSFSGNVRNQSSETVTVGDVTYTTSLKMESSTYVKFTISAKMTLTLYFLPASGNSVLINGTKYDIGSDGVLEVELTLAEGESSKEITIAKNSTNTYLFLVSVNPI